MTTWTLAQIQQARGIHAKCDVAADQLELHHDDALDAIHHQLSLAMRQIGHSFAIEIHPADVQLHEGERVEAPPFTVEVQAWWEPQVKLIELQGGWKDGERMEYRDAPQPIRIPLPPTPVRFDDAGPTEPIDIAAHYACIGWHEQERHWIYGPQ